jgi:hypothetical protein
MKSLPVIGEVKSLSTKDELLSFEISIDAKSAMNESPKTQIPGVSLGRGKISTGTLA